jgi:integrase/recombinase XerD
MGTKRNSHSFYTGCRISEVGKLDEYTTKAGVPRGVHPHSARATFITQALENGAKIEAVQRSVGHSKINTTQMYDKRLVRHRESASFAVRW